MRTVISSIVGAALLAAFAAVGSGLISGVYEQTKEPIAAAERAAEARQLLEIFPTQTHDNQLIDDTFALPPDGPLLALREETSGYRARMNGAVTGVILPATARRLQRRYSPACGHRSLRLHRRRPCTESPRDTRTRR